MCIIVELAIIKKPIFFIIIIIVIIIITIIIIIIIIVIVIVIVIITMYLKFNMFRILPNKYIYISVSGSWWGRVILGLL